MNIENDADLKKAAELAGELLQDIHDYCAKKEMTWVEIKSAKVRFPRGFIRTATSQRERLPFIKDEGLRSNLSYTLMLSDAILWLSLRTDIASTAAQMLTKLHIFLMGTLAESITKDYLRTICGKSYKGRTEYLFKNKIISEEQRDQLDWLWDTRNNMHLFQVNKSEYENKYDVHAHRKASKAFKDLIQRLTEHKKR